MDVKLLLYLVGAAIWYFLKYRADQEKKSRQTTPLPAPAEIPAEKEKETPVRQVPMKPAVKRSPVSRKPLATQRSRGDSTASTPGSLEVLLTDIGTRPVKHNMSHESTHELTNGMPEHVQASPAAKIGQDLRSGRFDWQRAVIINELLQKRW